MTLGQILWIVGAVVVFLGSLVVNAARRSAQISREEERRI